MTGPCPLHSYVPKLHPRRRCPLFGGDQKSKALSNKTLLACNPSEVRCVGRVWGRRGRSWASVGRTCSGVCVFGIVAAPLAHRRHVMPLPGSLVHSLNTHPLHILGEAIFPFYPHRHTRQFPNLVARVSLEQARRGPPPAPGPMPGPLARRLSPHRPSDPPERPSGLPTPRVQPRPRRAIAAAIAAASEPGLRATRWASRSPATRITNSERRGTAGRGAMPGGSADSIAARGMQSDGCGPCRGCRPFRFRGPA